MSTPYRSLIRALIPAATMLATLSPSPGFPQAALPPISLADALRLAERYRAGAIEERRFTPAEFWRAVRPALADPRD